MGKLSDFFKSKRDRNLQTVGPGSGSKFYVKRPFSGDQIRLVVFKEHDVQGRRIIYDSSKEDSSGQPEATSVRPSCILKRSTQLNSPCRLLGLKNSPSCPPKPQKSRRHSSDANMLSEMIFGSAPMPHKASTVKIHKTRSPNQLMLTQVFVPNKIDKDSNRDSSSACSSLLDSMDSYSIQTEPETIPKRVEEEAEGSPVAQSVPVAVPPRPKPQERENDDSGISGSVSSVSSYTSTPLHSYSPSSTPSSQHSNSVSSHRWKRHKHTSLEYLENASSADETQDPIPIAKRLPKIGVGLIFSLPEDDYDGEYYFRNFFFAHMNLIEGHMYKLLSGIDNALRRKCQTMVRDAFHVFCTAIVDLYTAARLPDPVWINLMCCPTKRVPLCDKFLREFTGLVEKCDTKNSRFFISSLLTGVLSHHLAWVATVTPTGTALSGNYLAKHSATWLESLAKSHPYNPLWAQLSDLYGAIGAPLHMARTLVVGKRADLINRTLYVLSYFIRCSELQERVPRGKEAAERGYAEVFTDEWADRERRGLVESMSGSMLSNGSVETCTPSMSTSQGTSHGMMTSQELPHMTSSQELSKTPVVDTSVPTLCPDEANYVQTVSEVMFDCPCVGDKCNCYDKERQIEIKDEEEPVCHVDAFTNPDDNVTDREIDDVISEVLGAEQAKVDEWLSRCPEKDLFPPQSEFVSSDFSSVELNSIEILESEDFDKPREVAVDSGLGEERLDLGDILPPEPDHYGTNSNTDNDKTVRKHQGNANGHLPTINGKGNNDRAMFFCRQVSKEVVEERRTANVRNVGRVSDPTFTDTIVTCDKPEPVISKVPSNTHRFQNEKTENKVRPKLNVNIETFESSQEFDEYFTEGVTLPETVQVLSPGSGDKTGEHGRARAAVGARFKTPAGRCLMVQFTDEMIDACMETPLPATTELHGLEDSGRYSEGAPLARVRLTCPMEPTTASAPITPVTPLVTLDEVPQPSFVRHIELPLPTTDETAISVQIPSSDSNFGRSLLAGFSEKYMADFALHGTTDPGYLSRLHADLTSSLQACVLDEDVREVVCVVADTEQWTVRSLKCDVSKPDRVRHCDVTPARAVSEMIESVHSLQKMKMSPEFCLMHLEDCLQEIYFKSKMLAEFLTHASSNTLPTSREKLAQKFGFDVNDLGLYMAVASTHTNSSRP